MMTEIFLPEKTKKRRILSQRIVGISIQENSVTAAQVYAAPRATSIEKLFEEVIPQGAPSNYAERVGQAIKSVLTNFSRYNQIRASIPSSIVTFKELTLPFIDMDKIRMVIEYEVEPLLPFSLQEAVIDFIITDQNKIDKTSQIIVAAVRKQDLQGVFDIYKTADIDPDCVTVDLFALYGLYLDIDEYHDIETATAIVDVGSATTSVSFILNGKIRLIRNISRGLKTIAEHIGHDTGRQTQDILQDLINFGGQKPEDASYSQAAQKYISSFFTDIQFTLNSFSLKLNYYKAISKILFIGAGSNVKGLSEFGSTLLQIPCEPFSCEKLFAKGQFKNKTKTLVSLFNYTVALGTAIVYEPHDDFNLRKKEFAKTHSPLLIKQIITAASIIIALFVTIGARGIFQITRLNAIVSEQEEKAISQLKKIFPARHSALKKTSLPALFKAAEQYITEREEAWKPFLQENLQPLEILKDLTLTMDKKSFNTTIEKIAIELNEQGVPEIEILGIFASSRGAGKHFEDYGNFVKYFEQNSKLLTIEEEEPSPLEDEKGVRFTFNLKLKELKQ